MALSVLQWEIYASFCDATFPGVHPYALIGVAPYTCYHQARELIDNGQKYDVVLTQILLNNGIGVYEIRITIAVQVNFAVVLQYVSGTSSSIAPIVALSIILAEMLTWFIILWLRNYFQIVILGINYDMHKGIQKAMVFTLCWGLYFIALLWSSYSVSLEDHHVILKIFNAQTFSNY